MPRGADVIWTICGILLIIALLVWLVPHFR
jgi:hypothetical protein